MHLSHKLSSLHWVFFVIMGRYQSSGRKMCSHNKEFFFDRFERIQQLRSIEKTAF